MRLESKPNVYDYLDYRRYLKDYYYERKRVHRFFSYRYFASLVNVNSSSILKGAIDGKFNMERELIRKFSKAICQNRREAEYFENLVYFNQAKTIRERNQYFGCLLQFFRSKGHKILVNQYAYFSKWYIPVIRELLSVIDFKDDYKELAKKLRPRITQQQAKGAMGILLKNGFIRKDGRGFYRAFQPYITTCPEIKSTAVSSYQRMMMDLAKEALDRFPAEKREISTLTFSASPEALKEMKNEIKVCKAKLVDIIRRNKNENTVCQLNIGLFPLTEALD